MLYDFYKLGGDRKVAPFFVCMEAKGGCASHKFYKYASQTPHLSVFTFNLSLYKHASQTPHLSVVTYHFSPFSLKPITTCYDDT